MTRSIHSTPTFFLMTAILGVLFSFFGTEGNAQIAPEGGGMGPMETFESSSRDIPPTEGNGSGGEEIELTASAVQAGIDGAVDYLRRSQRNGAWEGYSHYDPGMTSLCLLALLSTGLTSEDKTIASGLDYLTKFRPETVKQTYPIALQTMVYCQADPEKYRSQIEENVDWLIRHQFKTTNNYRGGWSYTGLQPNYSMADNSNSQFAVLALYEAELAGIPIPDEVWGEIRDYWVRLQNPDGSWGYRGESQYPADWKGNRSGNGTGSMTCAGIVALLVSSANRSTAASVNGDRIACCQENENEDNLRIEAGFHWLSEHFSIQRNPGMASNSDYLFYYLYGLERTGRLTARRFIGQNDWYREGANYLLRRKGTLSQFWQAGNDFERVNAVTTSFALLFLSKGRWPVLISKLKYDDPSSSQGGGFRSEGTTEPLTTGIEWNLHPDDLDHLTKFTEKVWGQKMTWQVIDARKATVDDFVQTPVLSISGRLSPLPADSGERKRLVENLREYLEQGGFLMAEALDGDISFTSGFQELMSDVFPDEENGGLHLLSEDHPIWSMEFPIPTKWSRPVYGIEFGCRTSVIFIPQIVAGKSAGPTPASSESTSSSPPSVEEDRPSLSCLWELAGNLYRDRGYPEEIQSEVDAALALGVNILAYATGRELKYKEEIPKTLEELDGPADKRSDFYASILDLGGGSGCASRAIPNLMRRVESDLGIPVRTRVDKIRADSPDLFYSPLLFVHGRNRFTLTEEEVTNLQDYFARGGFLFANALCASRSFTESFTKELGKIFPDAVLEPIPADDPIFSNRYGGYSITELEIRKPVRTTGNRASARITKEPPELTGIKKDGRWIVIFSPYDVSCALQNAATIETVGYTPDSAFRLSVNILLYAMEHL